MSIHSVSSALAFTPVRIGLTVAGGVAGLLGIVAAVRPDMVMTIVHMVMPG